MSFLGFPASHVYRTASRSNLRTSCRVLALASLELPQPLWSCTFFFLRSVQIWILIQLSRAGVWRFSLFTRLCPTKSMKLSKVSFVSTNLSYSFARQFQSNLEGTNVIAGPAGTWNCWFELLSTQQHWMSHLFCDGYCVSGNWELIASRKGKCFPSCPNSRVSRMSSMIIKSHRMHTNFAKHCATFR